MTTEASAPIPPLSMCTIAGCENQVHILSDEGEGPTLCWSHYLTKQFNERYETPSPQAIRPNSSSIYICYCSVDSKAHIFDELTCIAFEPRDSPRFASTPDDDENDELHP